MRYMINYNESVMKVLNSVAEKLEEYGFKTCITNSSENFIDWKLYYGYGKVLVGVDVLDILNKRKNLDWLCRSTEPGICRTGSGSK